ncbi:hypothetical protein QCE81_39205 [Caballeronia sp. LZ002]|nr:hypothetical protein [Caballeronia sp. LZ002]MDR5798517.1 hypothetical protein [Caballeronia sp. LZ001]MDR5853235.1 hypothetical protein [Caballeronia sp. LZ003]
MLKLCYGNFLCHAFHLDYIVAKGHDCVALEHEMLEWQMSAVPNILLNSNVGHLYEAKPALADFYRSSIRATASIRASAKLPNTRRIAATKRKRSRKSRGWCINHKGATASRFHHSLRTRAEARPGQRKAFYGYTTCTCAKVPNLLNT